MSAIPPQKVSHRHEAIINYMVSNPTAKLGQVAVKFGMTQSWLSVLIHSSSFKAKLQARQETIFTEEVCATVEERLMGVASVATDRLLELVPRETDVRVITNAMDKTLKNLGYGQKTVGTPLQQNNTLVINGGAVTASTLNRARDLVGAARNVTEVEPLEESESVGGSDLPQISEGGESSLGALDPIAALLAGSPLQEPEISPGPEVRSGSLVEDATKI